VPGFSHHSLSLFLHAFFITARRNPAAQIDSLRTLTKPLLHALFIRDIEIHSDHTYALA
jgi:hypothetical protein